MADLQQFNQNAICGVERRRWRHALYIKKDGGREAAILKD